MPDDDKPLAPPTLAPPRFSGPPMPVLGSSDAAVDALFDMLDKDGSGSLSRAEFGAADTGC